MSTTVVRENNSISNFKYIDSISPLYEDFISEKIGSIDYETHSENFVLSIKTGELNEQNVMIKKKYFEYQNLKNIAITNLLIKINFLSLTLDLAENQITEDEYYEEIEKNPTRYIIDMKIVRDENVLVKIERILNELKTSIPLEVISEMFSLDLTSYSKSINIIES